MHEKKYEGTERRHHSKFSIERIILILMTIIAVATTTATVVQGLNKTQLEALDESARLRDEIIIQQVAAVADKLVVVIGEFKELTKIVSQNALAISSLLVTVTFQMDVMKEMKADIINNRE